MAQDTVNNCKLNGIMEKQSNQSNDQETDEMLHPSKRSRPYLEEMDKRIEAIVNEPSEFQKEITQLSYEEFTESTNIKEIIEKEHKHLHGQNDAMSEEAMTAGLRYYFEHRASVKKWWISGLKHLKFLTCECKRNKIMKDTGIEVKVLCNAHRQTQCSVKQKDSQIQCVVGDVNDTEKLVSAVDSCYVRLPFVDVTQNQVKDVAQSIQTKTDADKDAVSLDVNIKKRRALDSKDGNDNRISKKRNVSLENSEPIRYELRSLNRRNNRGLDPVNKHILMDKNNNKDAYNVQVKETNNPCDCPPLKLAPNDSENVNSAISSRTRQMRVKTQDTSLLGGKILRVCLERIDECMLSPSSSPFTPSRITLKANKENISQPILAKKFPKNLKTSKDKKVRFHVGQVKDQKTTEISSISKYVLIYDRYTFLNYIDIRDVCSEIFLQGFPLRAAAHAFEIRDNRCAGESDLTNESTECYEITINGDSMQITLILEVAEWLIAENIVETLRSFKSKNKLKLCTNSVLYSGLHYLFNIQSRYRTTFLKTYEK